MRRRYIWSDKHNALIPAEEFYSAPRVHHVIGDSQEFRVPGSRVVVSGKRARREYMKRNGLEELGNDKAGFERECANQRKYADERETKELKSKLTEVLRDREFFRGR